MTSQIETILINTPNVKDYLVSKFLKNYEISEEDLLIKECLGEIESFEYIINKITNKNLDNIFMNFSGRDWYLCLKDAIKTDKALALLEGPLFSFGVVSKMRLERKYVTSLVEKLSKDNLESFIEVHNTEKEYQKYGRSIFGNQPERDSKYRLYKKMEKIYSEYFRGE